MPGKRHWQPEDLHVSESGSIHCDKCWVFSLVSNFRSDPAHALRQTSPNTGKCMNAQRFIREIGRGREGSRGLSRDLARQMFDSLFESQFDAMQVGAILQSLRMKGETVHEVWAGIEAVEARMRPIPVDPARPVISIPSYNGARNTPNLVPLLACLLADAGVQVLIHGVTHDPARTTTANVMQAMGIGSTNAVQASQALRRGVPAFVPIEAMSDELARLLELRARLGVRNIGHTLAKLINPTDSPSCMRLTSFTHPEYRELQRELFLATGWQGMMLRATEGEAVANTRRPAQIDWLRDGRCQTVVSARSDPARELPSLPDSLDAGITARWIQSVLSGERPVPEAIQCQADAILDCLGLGVAHGELQA